MKKYFFIVSTFLIVTFMMTTTLPTFRGPDDLIVGHSETEIEL